jgi:RNA polymerase sigma factor (TIGR02999 family)
MASVNERIRIESAKDGWQGLPEGALPIQTGEDDAVHAWFRFGYGELQRMAEIRLKGEARADGLTPAALVDEVWLRLGGEHPPHWRNRAHFFGAAARAMRRILIDGARRRLSLRRGGGAVHVDIYDPDLGDPPEAAQRLLWVDEGVDGLGEVDRKAADIVLLRFFGGFSVGETSRALGISESTVHRHWEFARAWLRREFSDT